jgi:hypothetical protein
MTLEFRLPAKFSLEQATKLQRGSRGSSIVSLTPALDGVGGQRHNPVALPPEKNCYLYTRVHTKYSGLTL